MFFADVPEDMAGKPPSRGSRFVTVVRVEADHGTMFLPDFWRLPCPHMVRQFSEALLRAMRHHADAHPSVQQYVCVSQTRKMDFSVRARDPAIHAPARLMRSSAA